MLAKAEVTDGLLSRICKCLLKANKALQRCHQEADRQVTMHRVTEQLVNATRPDGQTTEGLFIDAGDKSVAHGDEGEGSTSADNTCIIAAQASAAAEVRLLEWRKTNDGLYTETVGKGANKRTVCETAS